MPEAVVPRVCEMIGGPWDGDRTTARPWPLEIRSDDGQRVLGRYVLTNAEERGPCGQCRRVQRWQWEPES